MSSFAKTTSATLDKFDHLFEGWSVWIEPDEEESTSIVQEIEYLSVKCGGAEKGVYPFAPHCTLLYNIPPLTDISDESVESKEKLEKLLIKCIDKFRQSTSNGQEDTPDESVHNQRLQLVPTSFYYFAYPKHADNGKGFGCVISLLILKQTAALHKLHAAVMATFPPDERHSNFVPHVSFVYAPESRAEWLQQYTSDLKRDKQALLKPFCAKYLSLWSTKGQVNDWYRIARVNL